MPRSNGTDPFPLDLQRVAYSYIERPNRAIMSLFEKHVLTRSPGARVLDVGCGCGANVRELKRRAPGVKVTGIEPNHDAAELARTACDELFEGTLEQWPGRSSRPGFDALILSDVLEHVADPVTFLRSLRESPAIENATWIVSVPNYAVWYNRARTLLGRFDYAWSGLYDRTHLRFYTRRSIRQLLDYAGLEVVDDCCTPSLVQSTAPLLRRFFKDDVASGKHLALTDNRSYQVYERFVEPLETTVCGFWPELMAFQVVSVARPK